MKAWNMTNGGKYNYSHIYDVQSMIEYLSINGQRKVEMLDSHYDMILEKWFFYIRVDGEYGINIYQITNDK